MTIKNKHQRHQYQELGKLSTELLWQLYERVAPGVMPIEIDRLAAQLCRAHGVAASFYGVEGKQSDYAYSTCIQLNDVVVHGIPSTTEAIKSGDLVTVDFGIKKDGLCTDHCFTIGVGKVSAADRQLLEVGRTAVQQAVKLAVEGSRVGDLGSAMLSTAQAAGFTTAKKYVGHGIGHSLHEFPELPAFGEAGTGAQLKTGMVLCVEAQVMAGSDQTKTDPDGWTVRSSDGANSVMFEYMVMVDKRQPLMLTPTLNWPLIKD